MIANGVTREIIARTVGVDVKTLAKHYSYELETGAALANERVAGVLYAKAIDPKPSMASVVAALFWLSMRRRSIRRPSMASVVAALFWLKTRARWKEVTAIEHSGPEGDALPDRRGNVFLIPDNGRDPEISRLYAQPLPKHVEAMLNPAPKQLAPPQPSDPK